MASHLSCDTLRRLIGKIPANFDETIWKPATAVRDGSMAWSLVTRRLGIERRATRADERSYRRELGSVREFAKRRHNCGCAKENTLIAGCRAISVVVATRLPTANEKKAHTLIAGVSAELRLTLPRAERARIEAALVLDLDTAGGLVSHDAARLADAEAQVRMLSEALIKMRATAGGS
jgi:hypothetical protein